MTTIKFIALTILGLGLGFGASQVIADNNTNPFSTDPDNDLPYGIGCHYDEDAFFMGHYIEQFSDEDQLLIEAYIDTLLIEYDVTLEELYEDFDLRHEFMEDVYNYIEEQGLEPEDEYRHGHHMGW